LSASLTRATIMRRIIYLICENPLLVFDLCSSVAHNTHAFPNDSKSFCLRKTMKRFVVLFPILFLSLCPLVAAQDRTYTIEALLRVRRVGDSQISPDGKRVAFTIGDVNYDANRIVTQIYTKSLEGGDIKQLTSGDRSSSSPRWSPDGKKIAFTTG